MWKYISSIASFNCPWIELIGEKWQDSDGNILEYWRTKSADSVIVIPEYDDCFLLPRKVFRPGAGVETLDFPGGRLSIGRDPKEVAIEILNRELGIRSSSIIDLIEIYRQPKWINSSSSSQRLFGVYAKIDHSSEYKFLPHIRFKKDSVGINKLLNELDCLQCRALLFEHLYNRDVKLAGDL